MKRSAVIKKIRQGAKRAGVDFEMYELTNHTGIRCGEVATTIGRHTEIPELMALTIYKQLAPALGDRWWTA
ncbi:MAG: hypothetical protein L0I24_24070 [Pseudonocardia sp.]|nr:hypothetical protein [Pseudonocardia sp.]